MHANAGTGHISSHLRRCSFVVLLIVVAAFTYLDYWSYSQQFRLDPVSIVSLANGTGLAPAQYRVGLIYAAKYVLQATHGHISYRHTFGVFDFFAALAAGLLTRSVLFRTHSFLSAPPLSQWLRLFILLGLAVYYLNWSMWYQRPETWMCTLFVAASMYLLSAVRSAPAAALGLFALAAVQSVVRSDVAILFHFALFLVVLFRGRVQGFLVPRATLLAASAASGSFATLVLWLLMHKVFPHANYGDTPVFQFVRNLSPVQLVPAFLFLAPTLYTFRHGGRSGAAGYRQGETLLLASVLYLASWAVVGRLEEVRIFVPFAWALMPQTANALASRLVGPLLPADRQVPAQAAAGGFSQH